MLLYQAEEVKKDTNFELNFLGIGAEKAATTWIANNLSSHPEVHIPKKKELYFFNQYDPHYFAYEGFNYRRGLDWYEKQFKGSKPGQINGEFTPTYLYCEQAVLRIKEHYPDVKLIVVLRNPIERAYSQYVHDIRIGLVNNETFERALEKNATYIEKGFYYKHLQKYLDNFDSDKIGIYLQDDIKEDPHTVLKLLYNFIDLKNQDYVSPDVHKRINNASKPAIPYLNTFLIKTEYFLRNHNLDSLIDFANDLKIKDAALYISNLNKISYTNDAYPKMRESTRDRLKDIFISDIHRLEKLLKRDLSTWYN